MQYPLYNYYLESDLTLEKILKHYISNFYLRKHGRDKAEKVLYKVSDSSKMNSLFNTSVQKGIAPNYMDFGSVINEMMYFMFQSNSTQALAVLAAAIAWDKKVNRFAQYKSARDLRDDTLKIFNKFSIYEEMTESEYKKMTNSLQANESDSNDWMKNVPTEERYIWENPEFQNKLIDIYADCETEEQAKAQILLLIEQFRKK